MFAVCNLHVWKWLEGLLRILRRKLCDYLRCACAGVATLSIIEQIQSESVWMQTRRSKGKGCKIHGAQLFMNPYLNCYKPPAISRNTFCRWFWFFDFYYPEISYFQSPILSKPYIQVFLKLNSNLEFENSMVKSPLI